MNYISATHLLEWIEPSALVVNNPAEVRNAPEKLFVTRYLDLTPPTLITRSPSQLKEFTEHGDMILKPLYGNGGAGVFRLGPDLKARGLLFVGIDVIGDWLTQINVTSPTAIREIARFGGADIAAAILDAIVARRA
jgi:glutathione synthase/RimK-type ligase-like ATP-grasp enzyme